MKNQFRKFFEYNNTANKNYLQYIDSNLVTDEFVLSETSHLVSAHEIWNCRITGGYPSSKLWETNTLHDIEVLNIKNHETTYDILKGMDGNEVVNYKNSSGKEFSGLITDILFHVLNHSNYHRARVGIKLKEMDYLPPNSDYIFYMRGTGL